MKPPVQQDQVVAKLDQYAGQQGQAHRELHDVAVDHDVVTDGVGALRDLADDVERRGQEQRTNEGDLQQHE